jgi:AraC-like DNA-binding protein
MLAAVELLDLAEPVHATAAAVGYTTSSGFIAAFTNEFGVTPARYSRTVHSSST